MLLYTDDATISVTGRDVNEVESKLSQPGESVSHWCAKDNLVLSLTNVTRWLPRQDRNSHKYKLAAAQFLV